MKCSLRLILAFSVIGYLSGSAIELNVDGISLPFKRPFVPKRPEKDVNQPPPPPPPVQMNTNPNSMNVAIDVVNGDNLTPPVAGTIQHRPFEVPQTPPLVSGPVEPPNYVAYPPPPPMSPMEPIPSPPISAMQQPPPIGPMDPVPSPPIAPKEPVPPPPMPGVVPQTMANEKPHQLEVIFHNPENGQELGHILVDSKPLDIVDGVIVPTPKYPQRPQIELLYEV